MIVHELQSGPISVIDYRCALKPGDRPLAAVHRAVTVAYVRRGSFAYHARGQVSELVTGSVLIGQAGDEYVCTHEDSFGDECLAFEFSASAVSAIGGRRWFGRANGLPPIGDVSVFGELAVAAADGHSDIGLDEAGLLLAARVARTVWRESPRALQATPRDRRRAIEAAYWIDAHSGETIDLEQIAREAGLSMFHFLRLFTRVLSLTPHQYLIRARLRHAAQLLAAGATSITEVAADVGFGDLSNFVRTFRRAAGVSPGEFQRAARGGRKIFQDRPVAVTVYSHA
ncbi:MAG TPA: AraC family transcriptional regulator [bacterium]|nr:AraC family transcriptional regulator [bacterium]